MSKINIPIVYESGVFHMGQLDYRLVDGKNGVYIEHRNHGGNYWDISYGKAQHTQDQWDIIKREGIRL